MVQNSKLDLFSRDGFESFSGLVGDLLYFQAKLDPLARGLIACGAASTYEEVFDDFPCCAVGSGAGGLRVGQIEHDLLLWSKLGDSPGALAAEADYCEEFDSNPVAAFELKRMMWGSSDLKPKGNNLVWRGADRGVGELGFRSSGAFMDSYILWEYEVVAFHGPDLVTPIACLNPNGSARLCGPGDAVAVEDHLALIRLRAVTDELPCDDVVFEIEPLGLTNEVSTYHVHGAGLADGLPVALAVDVPSGSGHLTIEFGSACESAEAELWVHISHAQPHESTTPEPFQPSDESSDQSDEDSSEDTSVANGVLGGRQYGTGALVALALVCAVLLAT